MSQEKFIQVQHQVRENQAELQDYLKGLDSWSEDIKGKDEKLKKQTPAEPEAQSLPPVRNSLEKKKKKKKVKKKSADKEGKEKKKISGFDFKAWDKFDVDKACEEIDKDEEKSSSSEYETDEEWEVQRKKQQAMFLKDQGNDFFKRGQYNEAIECYTRGLECDPTLALLSANRAMALIKQEKYGAAELDCTAALSIDPSYIKAYSRRGTARLALKKLKEAKEDFQQVLKLEPQNKQAKSDLEKIDTLERKALGNIGDEDQGLVKAVYKPPNQRSKKPLRRIPIEEIGLEEDAKIPKVATKSEEKLKVTAKDEEKFDKFFNPGQIGNVEETENEKPASVENISHISLSNKGVEEAKDVTSEMQLDLNGLESQSDIKKDKGKISEARSPSTSPRVPPLPASSFQFQTDCKALRQAPEQFYQYFKPIPPNTYPKLFGQALDSDMLMMVLNSLKDFYTQHQDDIFPVLQHLTQVKRFSMTSMFLSSQEKQVLKDIFEHLKSTSSNIQDVNSLAKQYGV